MNQQSPVHDLQGAIDKLLEETEGDDRISVGRIVEVYGSQSFGPLLAVVAVLIIAPTGAIPGVPAALGAVVILVVGQILIGRHHLWLPGFIQRMEMPRDRLVQFRHKANKPLGCMSKVVTRRLEWANRAPFLQIAAVMCAGLSVLMLPLEVIPFAVAIPGAAILFFGLGLTARDGLLMLIGIAIGIATCILAIVWLT